MNSKSQALIFRLFVLPLAICCQCRPAVSPTVTVGKSTALPANWEALAIGIEWAKFPAPSGENNALVVVRIDPKQRPLKLLCNAQLGHPSLTADEWAKRHRLSVVINAGMFEKDHTTHTGYLKQGAHIPSKELRQDYYSVAAFGPSDANLPHFRIFDTDAPDWTPDSLTPYQSAVQNLRLIKHPGENRWPQQSKRWSEAALGENGDGQVLLIFCSVGSSMHDFNAHLLSLPIGLQAAQHLEGGPEASLYVKCGAVEFRGMGSYETGFNENDSNHTFWKLPNVIGVAE